MKIKDIKIVDKTLMETCKYCDQIFTQQCFLIKHIRFCDKSLKQNLDVNSLFKSHQKWLNISDFPSGWSLRPKVGISIKKLLS